MFFTILASVYSRQKCGDYFNEMGFVLVGTEFTQPDHLIKLEVPTMMEVDPLPSPMMPVLICLFCCQEMTMRICDRVKHFVLPDWHATNRAGLAHDNFNRRQ